jgi:thymidylate synthase (FAD)
MKVVIQEVTLEFVTPNAAQFIERAGRTCYKSEDKITNESADKFVKMVIKRGHESVIEHANATFRVICDRGVSHEKVRHRLASYSQESTRFCNYLKEHFGGEIQVIEPPWVGEREQVNKAHDVWKDLCQHAERAYLELGYLGQPPELSRSVLPTCLKTEIVMTANFREWRHFLRLRRSPKAHPQMREVAQAIGAILLRECPPVFSDVMGVIP